MKISDPTQTTVHNEIKLLLDTLDLNDNHILELGCGRGDKTRAIANSNLPAAILALEVDERQHQKNLMISDLPTVTFERGGAEAIPAADNSFDLVILFKSLHHVPIEHMDQALQEIRRVLKPGGYAWISEPVFDGDLNEVMRLFHNEETVRQAAFAAVQKAVSDGTLQLKTQLFFRTRSFFENFDDFDRRMIQVTHTDHQLSPTIYEAVKTRFNAHCTAEGAQFYPPQRVDLLRKSV